MASERAALAATRQAGVLAAGAGAAWAGAHGLYACALTAALAGAGLAFGRMERARGGIGRAPRPEAPPQALDVALLRTLLNAAPAPLLLLEPGGAVRAVNRAARTLFGADDHVAHPPPELARALREEAAGGRRRLSLAVGEGLPRLYALSLADLGGPAAPRLAALLDVQAEVHAAEADALRRVLQVLGHELMNSLTPVTSLAASAADLLDGAPDAQAVAGAREAIAVVARRADGLARFVAGYRAVERLPEPRLRAVDLGELARDVVRLVRASPDARNVELVLRQPGDPLVRVTDADLLAQALSNVVVNAVEAARAVGAADARVEVTLEPLPDGARLEVSDTGPGVPIAQVEAIFLPFTTGKAGGSGVGLHLARSAMRSLGGEVLLLDAGGGPGRRTRLAIIL